MDDGMGDTVVLADHTCTNCHAPANPMGNGTSYPQDNWTYRMVIVTRPHDHKNAYTELVTGGNQQQLDANGVVTFVTILVPNGRGRSSHGPTRSWCRSRCRKVGAHRATVGARFDTIPRPICECHRRDRSITGPFLTPGELRLISEWIDIGAQYYNNQFDPGVPLNN